jgi:large subunit ribosomal protein L35
MLSGFRLLYAGRSRRFKVAKKQKAKKYKLKTHKATAKRFKVTGSGKIMRTKGGKSHLRRRKSKRAKRLFNDMLPVENAGERRRVSRLAPYLKKHKANPPG